MREPADPAELGETMEDEDKTADVKPRAASPYATGGGGVTFERRVAVQYLAQLLTGHSAGELGHERRVLSVAFQQGPAHPVDDLVVAAARAGETEPSLLLSLGVRRAPNLVNSDEPTQKLICDFVRAVISAPAKGPDYRFALVVAGQQDHAKQLATLTELAAAQMSAPAFFQLVRTPNKFTADLRGRLDQLEGLVRHALEALKVSDPSLDGVQKRTWELLSRLTVLMPRLEIPDETDWAALMNSLIPVARGGDLSGASRLRDRLVALADEYPAKAATVDLTVLRRGAHDAIDSSVRRHRRGWEALRHLDERATSSVHNDISAADGSRRFHVDRSEVATAILESASIAKGVVVHGDSGVGKSALLAAPDVPSHPDSIGRQAIRINLRHLPRTTLEFESLLGVPLYKLLAELSAPRRLVILDGADAVAEGMTDQLRYVAEAAWKAEVAVVAITAAENKQVVRDTLAERFGAEVVEHAVPALTDAQVDQVVASFGELANLATNPRSRELLRRPVVIDLLVRGGFSEVPLSDFDAMQQVWRGLVRRREQSDRGTPDAREVAMLRLADLALAGGDPLQAMGAVDPAALEGLRKDGLLRSSIDDPFKIGPEFSHDEVRRYAVARLLLTENSPTSKLLKARVPRWTLGAARLACQARLGQPDNPSNPLKGRLARLQAAFDALVEGGYGERWGDVPGEALLTLGEPDPVLRDAWTKLRAGNGDGLQRLGRLIDQRLRDAAGLVRIGAVEPVVAMLLDEETPWSELEAAFKILRDWLRAHVIANTPPQHPLRVRLRERLVTACKAGDQRLEAERVANAAAKASRSLEEIEEDRRLAERRRTLSSFVPGKRRERPEVPSEVTDEMVVELLALLGPDLGGVGEEILRRVGRDAPMWLSPAVEGLFTGRSLASYDPRFLADLTQDYYVDRDGTGSGLDDDGIRDHSSRVWGTTPLAAWYRGPFMPLFQANFRAGVRVINRMLNRGASSRARTLVSIGRHDLPIADTELAVYSVELEVAGARRAYVGDPHVWLWYRGTGVGPYPCMSALMALERACDALVRGGAPLRKIVAILLDGCESLAMVGFVVGLLVRNLNRDDKLLDPYLAEPLIWQYEFNRVIHESSGLAGPSDEISGAERRKWSMREVATFLAVHADDARAAELRGIGHQLVENACLSVHSPLERRDGTDSVAAEKSENELIMMVRGWASGLDRNSIRVQPTESGLVVHSTPPKEVVEALKSGEKDVRRSHESMRLTLRYGIDPWKGPAEEVPTTELLSDLSVARDLVASQEHTSTSGDWNAATAIAGVSLSAHLLRGVPLPDDFLAFAVEAILQVGTNAPSREAGLAHAYYQQGADRSAARALPLLLDPARPWPQLGDPDGSSTYGRAVEAAFNLASGASLEVRLHLARGLDQLWRVPCAPIDGECRHQVGMRLALESMRDCSFGEWDPNFGPSIRLLEDPITGALAQTPGNAIDAAALDAAIRALGPAASANICVSASARVALEVALSAQRRSLLAHERDLDHRGTHALVSARALLTLAASGDDACLLSHVAAIAKNAALVGTFMRALSSAAEESVSRATTARRVWPDIMGLVLKQHASDHALFDERYSGDTALSSLLPNTSSDVADLYPELEGKRIVWWEPLALRDLVERWLPIAAGRPRCVDQLISFLGMPPPEELVQDGLNWVTALVLPEAEAVATGSFLICSWLIEIRASATNAGLLPEWQRLVDALVVAGANRLAPYSE